MLEHARRPGNRPVTRTPALKRAADSSDSEVESPARRKTFGTASQRLPTNTARTQSQESASKGFDSSDTEPENVGPSSSQARGSFSRTFRRSPQTNPPARRTGFGSASKSLSFNQGAREGPSKTLASRTLIPKKRKIEPDEVTRPVQLSSPPLPDFGPYMGSSQSRKSQSDLDADSSPVRPPDTKCVSSSFSRACRTAPTKTKMKGQNNKDEGSDGLEIASPIHRNKPHNLMQVLYDTDKGSPETGLSTLAKPSTLKNKFKCTELMENDDTQNDNNTRLDREDKSGGTAARGATLKLPRSYADKGKDKATVGFSEGKDSKSKPDQDQESDLGQSLSKIRASCHRDHHNSPDLPGASQDSDPPSHDTGEGNASKAKLKTWIISDRVRAHLDTVAERSKQVQEVRKKLDELHEEKEQSKSKTGRSVTESVPALVKDLKTCPFCSNPLPKRMTRGLQNVLQPLLNQFHRTHGHVAGQQTVSVCMRHEDERTTVPEGLKHGWPITFDSRKLLCRIKPPESKIGPGPSSDGSWASGKGCKSVHWDRLVEVITNPKQSHWFNRQVKKIKVQGQRAFSAAAQMDSVDDQQAGYYGERGWETLLTMCLMEFLADPKEECEKGTSNDAASKHDHADHQCGTNFHETLCGSNTGNGAPSSINTASSAARTKAVVEANASRCLSLRHAVNAETISPLTPTIFIHSVLVPELIVSLLQEDLRHKGQPASIADAIQLRDASTRYGSALFPADERLAIDPINVKRLLEGKSELISGSLDGHFARMSASGSSSQAPKSSQSQSEDESRRSISSSASLSGLASTPEPIRGRSLKKKPKKSTFRITDYMSQARTG